MKNNTTEYGQIPASLVALKDEATAQLDSIRTQVKLGAITEHEAMNQVFGLMQDLRSKHVNNVLAYIEKVLAEQFTTEYSFLIVLRAQVFPEGSATVDSIMTLGDVSDLATVHVKPAEGLTEAATGVIQ